MGFYGFFMIGRVTKGHQISFADHFAQALYLCNPIL